MKPETKQTGHKTQHTPGPWVFAYGSVYRQDTLHDESSIRIALMDRNEVHTTPCERDANAQLIAAAPELFEALETMMGYVDPFETRPEHYEQAHAALQKARGKQ